MVIENKKNLASTSYETEFLKKSLFGILRRKIPTKNRINVLIKRILQFYY